MKAPVTKYFYHLYYHLYYRLYSIVSFSLNICQVLRIGEATNVWHVLRCYVITVLRILI